MPDLTPKNAPPLYGTQGQDDPAVAAVLYHRGLVDDLGSQRAVADRLGVSETVISRWWLAHGLEPLRPQPSQKQRSAWIADIRQRIETGTLPTQARIAEEFGISKASVNRLVKQAREGMKHE